MKTLGFLLLVGLLGAGGLFWGVVQPGGDGVVASIRLPDGSDYMVTQRCNWSAEPYTVALWSRERGGDWGWNYVDHESLRWWSTKADYDEAAQTVSFVERGVLRVRVDLKAKEVWLKNERDGGMRLHAPLPQETETVFTRRPPYAFPTH